MYELHISFCCFKRTVAEVTTCSKLDYHFSVSSPHWFLSTDIQHGTYGEVWSLLKVDLASSTILFRSLCSQRVTSFR